VLLYSLFVIVVSSQPIISILCLVFPLCCMCKSKPRSLDYKYSASRYHFANNCLLFHYFICKFFVFSLNFLCLYFEFVIYIFNVLALFVCYVGMFAFFFGFLFFGCTKNIVFNFVLFCFVFFSFARFVILTYKFHKLSTYFTLDLLSFFCTMIKKEKSNEIFKIFHVIFNL
jgi:hypothetical protein